MPRDLRTSAANLRLLAATYDSRADIARDVREVVAWNDAMLRLMDAAGEMDAAADAIEGVWALPLENA